MDEDAYADESIDVVPARWHWSFLAIRTLCFGANIANATRTFLGEVAADVASYANYQMERDEFAAEAGRELEQILNGPEED